MPLLPSSKFHLFIVFASMLLLMANQQTNMAAAFNLAIGRCYTSLSRCMPQNSQDAFWRNCAERCQQCHEREVGRNFWSFKKLLYFEVGRVHASEDKAMQRTISMCMLGQKSAARHAINWLAVGKMPSKWALIGEVTFTWQKYFIFTAFLNSKNWINYFLLVKQTKFIEEYSTN